MINSALPQHIGIIMDGNGRWAQKHKRPRTFGHQEGLKTGKKIIHHVHELGIPYVTLYAFSTENWKRTEEEVGFLMNLIHTYIRKEIDFYRDNGIKLMFSGELSRLPADIQDDVTNVIEDTSGFTDMTVNIALNYGGRDEIIRAFNSIAAADNNRDFSLNPVSEEELHQQLDSGRLPDPDLIIRTGGDMRLSNFLLWTGAYSELYFTPVLWPDFNEHDLESALKDYKKRTRRFGGTHE
ncbi:polyprenyl diphosphate synthase [Spirochaeta dissipatitropha]